MSDIDPHKLKVVELRAELAPRGLDTKGNKATLIRRLQQALNKERGTATSEGEGASEDHSGLDTSQDSALDDSMTKDEKADIPEKEETEIKNESESEEIKKSEEAEKPSESEDTSNNAVKEEDATAVNGNCEEMVAVKDEPTEPEPEPELEPEEGKEETNDEAAEMTETAEEKVDVKPENEEQQEVEDNVPEAEEKEDKEQVEPEAEEKMQVASDISTHRRAERRKRSRSSSGERRRNRSRSSSRERKRSLSKTPPKEEVEEEIFDKTILALDSYNCDLNLIVDKSRYSAIPFTDDSFALMWSGIKATHGFKTGKVCFEVKVLKHLDISHLPADEPNPHVVRVGVSTSGNSLQLGEDPQSYGYGGTGKASTNCQFKDYGAQFGEGDIIACFVDLDKDPIEISFTKNGSSQGIAYSIPREQIGEKSVYPHVLTKNCSFEVNFGQRETPYFPLPKEFEDFTFVNCTAFEDRVAGLPPPQKRSDCEMMMMCGLPGAGKSTWVTNYCAQNPDKNYNVLGTNNIIDKMKVMGLPRKRNYAGRWDVLIDKSTKCLNKLLELASKVKRNFILDQVDCR